MIDCIKGVTEPEVLEMMTPTLKWLYLQEFCELCVLVDSGRPPASAPQVLTTHTTLRSKFEVAVGI